MAPEDYGNRLFQIITNESFTAEFIAGIAGDRLQSDEEKALFNKLTEESGDDFYVKLLFFITHEIFEERQAFALWEGILRHKQSLAAALGRNVEITVATLDYLTNIKSELRRPQLIGEAFFAKIAEMSSIDPLTKLYNRQHLSQVVESERLRYVRYSIPFSLLMIDLDNFKDINDAYGHQEGDSIIVRVSAEICASLRELDVCTRYGGDEFLLILPHTEQEMAFEIAERIRSKIETLPKESHGITLSIGVSSCPRNGTEIEGLIKAADDAAYSSKRHGKNATTIQGA
jgi:diguanylate cyclase (GGDEF)-like protein